MKRDFRPWMLALAAAACLCPVLAPRGARAAETPPFAVPPDSTMPGGEAGASIRRGRAITLDTPDSLPAYAKSALSCTNCHIDAGTRAASGPWVGVASSFPQDNARAGRTITLEDRINECFRRSLGGSPLPPGRDLADIVAYMRFLSVGVPQGTKPEWLGLRKLEKRAADAKAGRTLFAGACVRCHGPRGQGTDAAPPLWGPKSFAIGAGMARLGTAASFIRWNMPFDRPGTLTDQQAWDLAAFVTSHRRPDTRGKEKDWPKGDAPEDCAYPTLAGRKGAGAATAAGR